MHFCVARFVVPICLDRGSSRLTRVTTEITPLSSSAAYIAMAVVHAAIHFPFRAPLKADFSDNASLAARAKFAFLLAWRCVISRLPGISNTIELQVGVCCACLRGE